MIQLNVNVPLVNGENSLQKLVENIQLLTVEETSIHRIQYNMDSLGEQISDVAIRVSKCEDQVIRITLNSRYIEVKGTVLFVRYNRILFPREL